MKDRSLYGEMIVLKIENPQFIKTAIKEKDYPVLRNDHGDIMPEIAVAGRSNVGKSSLLNNLFRKDLVKTSATPGKTQHLNFFTVNDSICFVDLPGYGFAQVPPEVRKQWGPMVQAYLENREQLKMMFLLFDIRRTPNKDDMIMLEWAKYNQVPVILVLTKVDKVGNNEKRAQTQKILKAFDDESLPYLHYSVTKNIGRIELIHKLEEQLWAT